MTHPFRNRSNLMLSCGSTALALALALAPQGVQAQAINAAGNVVQGSVTIDDMVPGETTVNVASSTAVIDWTPAEDGNGNALNFLPTGTTAIYRSGTLADFAVLNRILPSTNGNFAVIDGAVLSRVIDPATGASIPGGFVAFYSPTGILIGDNATFDVGKLLLTTLDTSPTDFQNFAELGGNLALAAAPGSTARIQINPGAQILATPENSFFAVVAADVQMLGTAQVNGSHAFVAGEVVNLSFSNGLFFISVPVGTAATGTVLEVDGTVGGPSSTGLGDNHMIYGVAAAQADPISMIFSGNLGFAPAQSAGIVNGEIILSANYNVFGRNVDGGSISDGINAVFGANSATSTVQADIFLEDFAASSSVLAIGTHRTQVAAFNVASSVAGNLLVVGRENASLTASNGQNLTISGDVLVSAQDYGVTSSTLQSLNEINATGGVAFIDAFGGGTMNIGGSALVTADAFAGADTLSFIAGTAQGGQALIGSTGGTLNITGNATASARGVGTSLGGISTGATSRGGLAQFFARQGGQVTLGGNLNLFADAIGAQGTFQGPSSVSNAFGGNAFINVFDGGGTIIIGGDASAEASAFGGASNNAGAGSIGDGGVAIANINGGGLITITGQLRLDADGSGGDNAGGTGGVGLGGRASSAIFTGGTVTIGGAFNAEATGAGGDGLTGGDGIGGIAGAIAEIGTLSIGQNAFATSAGLGGRASFGFGGNGGLGRGGNAFFQANGTLTQTATLTITGDATAFAQGVGGDGGQSDDQAIAAGRGGDGFGGVINVPNQADPNFGGGAYLLSGGDNGTLSIGGIATALSTGFGGNGGGGGSVLPGGRGGDGFGGLAQAGLALLGQNGSLGQGTATFTSLLVESNGVGGNGGFSFGDFPTGDGGNGTGGNAFLTVRAGDITAGQIELDASGFGAGGAIAGSGTGGQAAVLGSLGGTLTANDLNFFAQGFGGFSGFGTGGSAAGGLAAIEGDGITVTINGNVIVDASASGGSSDDGAGGDATGGDAYIATVGNAPGSITITGHAQVLANASGGNTFTNFVAANATGGNAYIEALGGSTIDLGSAQVHAVGRGGSAATHQSGNGTGGAARIAASGANSRVTILRNVPNAFTETSGGFGFVNANGIADTTNGGNGIGGIGRGGTADVTATAGGTLNLPTNIANDPDAAFQSLAIFARGFGGDSVVEGGVGGAAFGGNVTILADGGTIVMGAATPSTFSEGGSSLDPALNITGGDVTGGTRTIRVVNGGQLTIESAGGGTGAQGGNGSGTGNGGNAVAGNVVFEIINSTANLIGGAPLFNNSAGGTGQIGGNVSGGTITLNAVDSLINLSPNAAGNSALSIGSEVRGGNGITAGGNAQGSLVLLTLDGTQVTGGNLATTLTATGGNASAATGLGGNATGSTLAANLIDATLNFSGEVLFAADAIGGNGGISGVGGSATTGDVDVVATRSTIAIADVVDGSPGILRVRAQAIGGQGATNGNATSRRALLNLVDSTLTATSVYVESRAFANTISPGQIGGTALSVEARLNLFGVSGITAGLVEVNASAASSQGGSSTGGFAALEAGIGSTATVTAPQVNLLADATTGADTTNGIAGATQGGSVFLSAAGGNLTINGNVVGRARAVGVTANSVVSGAVARGGVAQLRAQQGGSVTLNGNIVLDASATGSDGSLAGPSSVSNAFGGNAGIFVAPTGGTLAINGDASLNASAFGGSSNNAGAGSLADAGLAIANIDAAGTINISGLLSLDAEAYGGENAGGTGGLALGGRASAATFNGGIIRIGSFDADTLAQGGNGLIGGNGVGGIAGAIAQIGEVVITGNAFAGSDGVGGSATFGVGGNGGFGRGGNAFLQANGDLTRTARLAIGGDAVTFARGTGGNGGSGDAVTAGGVGGAGIGGGQGNVPNQADPAFGSGAFLLAGGDNGTLVIGGRAIADASATGGLGGLGGSGTAGGNGGNALAGLSQVGLALLGGDGSVGLGQARFTTVQAFSNAVAGNGGAAIDPAQTGAGGIGSGGTSALTVRAGDVIATSVELSGIGVGGDGSTGGNGTGGFVGTFGSFAGRLETGRLSVISQGYGGDSIGAGNGGIGRGSEAFLNFSLIDATISVDVLIDASGFGGNSAAGQGGDGIGLNARIGTLGTAAGNGTIAGSTRVIANGAGGTGLTAGSGIGGLAEAQALNGGVSGFASLELNATGQFGNAAGGIASLQIANGSTSQLNAASVQMIADAIGGTTNTAGQFSANVISGNANLGSLTASALGNAVSTTLPVSNLFATGGNLNVTGALSASAFGDIFILTNGGNIIGSAATAGTTTAIQLQSGGTIQLGSDGLANDGLSGQSISLQAGRSILGGNLTTFNGPITLTANIGGGQALATPPVSVITQGSRINAGTGTVTIRLLDGAGDPQRVNGAITLASISAGRIDVRNLGTSAGSDISVLANGVLTASGTGRAIDLASPNGEVINLAGDAGLVLTGGGHYAIFAATPTGSQIGSFANYARRYNVANAAAYDALNPGGNFAAFRIAPVLTVTADNATRFYGSADPVFTATFAGFQPGDGVANLTGTPLFTTAATATSNVGVFALNAALGSLLSEQGYQFTLNPGLLTITARPITITANNLSRLYGNANPALAFTVGGQGLVNGDQLTGALATTAGMTTGVGTVAITQGTLAATANYDLTFVGGLLTISPRLLSVTADDQAKQFGENDPVLTFVLTGDGLVNGDQLTGALVRDPGEAIATFAIRQGTLTAGSNYAISFTEGALTINAPPVSPEVTNPTVFDPPFLVSDDLPLTSEEEEERFGMDFPEQPDAALISEDPLLDDPVSSGADASLYSGGTTPTPRGEEM